MSFWLSIENANGVGDWAHSAGSGFYVHLAQLMHFMDEVAHSEKLTLFRESPPSYMPNGCAPSPKGIQSH